MVETVFQKQVILYDVNIPYKFAIDRSKNKLFFCINADEFSDQSFQSVVLDLETTFSTIVPSIRNGFASAVDNDTGAVYLGGSDGIYTYNYSLNDINKPALVKDIDVFDMHYKNNLYFIDTADLDLYSLKNEKKVLVTAIEEYGIQHFTFDGDGNIIMSNSIGLYHLGKDDRQPVWFSNSIGNIRGLATDAKGIPHAVGQDGIYTIDHKNKEVVKSVTLSDGYGLDFDKNNNLIYGDGRSVVKVFKNK